MKTRKVSSMESGKASLGFLLILLLAFGGAAGAGWLAFSDTKTGIPVIDGGIEKIQGLLPQSENANTQSAQNQEAHSDEGHDHDNGDHNHDNDTYEAEDVTDLPGKKGQVYNKPVNPVLGVRSVGDPSAPIQIREFFSLTCNHCATFHGGAYQALKQKYVDTGKVHFIFEEFPLNGPALYGSMIARSLPESRYESFISLLLKTQDEWAFGGDFKNALKKNAALAGMSEDQFEAAFNDKELQKAIATNIQESSNIWQISSTPSFVINDGERVMSGVRTVEDFEKVMRYLTDGKVGGNAVKKVMEEKAAPVIDLAPPPTPIDAPTNIEINTPDVAPITAPTSNPIVTPTAPATINVPEPVMEKKQELESTTIDINDLFEP